MTLKKKKEQRIFACFLFCFGAEGVYELQSRMVIKPRSLEQTQCGTRTNEQNQLACWMLQNRAMRLGRKRESQAISPGQMT